MVIVLLAHFSLLKYALVGRLLSVIFAARKRKCHAESLAENSWTVGFTNVIGCAILGSVDRAHSCVESRENYAIPNSMRVCSGAMHRPLAPKMSPAVRSLPCIASADDCNNLQPAEHAPRIRRHEEADRFNSSVLRNVQQRNAVGPLPRPLESILAQVGEFPGASCLA